MSSATNFIRNLNQMKAQAPAGFALAYQIRMTTPTYLFQSYTKEWNSYYSKNGLLMNDPTVLWGFENDGTIKWSDLKALDVKNVLEAASGFGMNFGITWASAAPGEYRSIGSFARSDREFTNDEVEELVTLAQDLHEATIGLTPLKEEDVDVLRSDGYVVSQTIN